MPTTKKEDARPISCDYCDYTRMEAEGLRFAMNGWNLSHFRSGHYLMDIYRRLDN